MNNKLAQLAYFINKVDSRHIQIAYFVFVVIGFLVAHSPSDGGTGPYKI